jgi:hypothetical protein
MTVPTAINARIELNSPSIQFDVTAVGSATVGFTPPSPGWTPGATFSLLVAHFAQKSAITSLLENCIWQMTEASFSSILARNGALALAAIYELYNPHSR